MADIVLPSSVDFSRKLPALPDGVSSQLLSLQATNGTGPFTPGSVIQFDLPSARDLYLDGKTMFIRFKITYTSGATAGVVRRKPVYTAFQKLDEFIGSTPINSVYNYHTAANLWVDTNMSVADIYGQQTAFGIGPIPSGGTPTLDQFDSVTLTVSADNSIFLAAPVVCSAVQSADHLWPTGLMPPIRMQFTVASIADQAVLAANITGISISHPELCIQSIQMPGVDAIISQSAPSLYVKCSGWANATTSLASGTSGYNSLIFNHRYESINNLFLVNSSSDATKGLNGPLESFDLTSSNGTYQFMIGQQLFPVQPINTSTSSSGRGSVLQYLRECVGSITDQRNSMSINAVEFARLASSLSAAASTAVEPGKFYVGCPLSKLSSSNPYQSVSLLSGVSAASAPISVLVNIGTATGSGINSQLIAQYDLLVELDPMSKNIRLVQ
jgi:hypothetical protein